MRPSSIVRLGGLLALVVTGLSGCDAPLPIHDQGYQLVFEDNFDTLDTSVWETAPYGGSLPPTVADGVMTVKTTAANGYQWGHVASTGPRQSSEPSYPGARAWEEGYFEARVRYTDTPWSWPAFWLFSMDKAEAWPGEHCPSAGGELTSEWDIMENRVWGGPSTPHDYFTALHRNTSDGTPDGYCGEPDGPYRGYEETIADTNLSDWHVWAGRWTETELCTYLDDVELTCMAPFDTTSQPMHLTFSMIYVRPEDCPAELCGPRPSEMSIEVDWVRVWQQP